jgi:Tfp pilus assembly protein PilO
MNEITKIILGGLFGVFIAVVVYEEYLMPKAIYLALKNAEITTLKSKLRNEIRQELLDLSIPNRIEESDKTTTEE